MLNLSRLLMRKAALVTGIICAVFTVIAAVLKLTGIPGGSFLFLIFAGAFAGVVMPMHYFAQTRIAQPGIKRIADFLGIITGMHLIIGLLFVALNWNGSMLFFVQGGFLALFFIGTFVVAAQKQGVITKWFSSFTVLFLIVVAALAIGCVTREVQKEETNTQYVVLQEEVSKYTAARKEMDQRMAVFSADTADQSLDSAANRFFADAIVLIKEIEEYKCAFLERLNRGESCRDDQGAYRVSRPDDYDISTMMLVGPDPQNLTGEGVNLYERMFRYRNYVLHPEVSFGVPVREQTGYKEQWVKDNFYHATALETLTRLTQIQTKICESVNESIDKRLFRK
jgi:hypothetical protein